MIQFVRSMAAGLLLVTALAACTGAAAAPSGVASLASQGPEANASAEPSASLDPEAARLEFARCMRENGIDMPDPETDGAGGGGVRLEIRGDDDREEMDAAMEACNHFLQDAGKSREAADPAMLDKMVEFAGCMREHGVDMPDPATNGEMKIERSDGVGSSSSLDGIDPKSPEFQAAEEACRPILGDMGPSFQSAPEPAKP